MIYKEGEKKLHNELNVLTILQTIQKLKASLSVLIKDEDITTLNDIKNVYLMNASIFMDEDEKREHEESKNEFTRFIERDDRDALRYEK